jgi:hypothetical protein
VFANFLLLDCSPFGYNNLRFHIEIFDVWIDGLIEKFNDGSEVKPGINKYFNKCFYEIYYAVAKKFKIFNTSLNP